MGGYRNGSGRSKTGYYKGIYCGSTYELCWVIYQLDHGITFTRFPTVLSWNDVKYFPDFLLSDGKSIVELKGYEPVASVSKKTEVAERNGYNVTVLRKDDLVDIFDYVSKTYTKNYQSLYDGYRPQFDYVCDQCGTMFGRDRKLKTELKFCTRQCAGSFRSDRRDRTKTPESNNYVRQLTRELALEVFHAEGSYSEIAARFGLKKNSVWTIKTKAFYKWIHNEE